jgi:hypothetical protein
LGVRDEAAAGNGAEAAEPGSEDSPYAGRGHRCTQRGNVRSVSKKSKISEARA